jgi:RNAse (barnase) inhibitor barstar
MASKPLYEIDGNQFSTLEEFYDEISRVLIPNTPWGHGLDAFNDILRGGFGTPEDGFILQWKNADRSRQCLGYAETIRHLQRRLGRCDPTNRALVTRELERAKRGEGPTAFHWILEILRDHAPGSPEDSGVELVLI